jgi:hypothetical protein
VVRAELLHFRLQPALMQTSHGLNDPGTGTIGQR